MDTGISLNMPQPRQQCNCGAGLRPAERPLGRASSPAFFLANVRLAGVFRSRRKPPVAAGVIRQGLAPVDPHARHFPYQDIVIAGGDPAAESALDFGQDAGQQRRAGFSPAPLQAIEAVLALRAKRVEISR